MSGVAVVMVVVMGEGVHLCFDRPFYNCIQAHGAYETLQTPPILSILLSSCSQLYFAICNFCAASFISSLISTELALLTKSGN